MSGTDDMLEPESTALWLSAEELGILKAGLAAHRIALLDFWQSSTVYQWMAVPSPLGGVSEETRAAVDAALALTERLTEAQILLAREQGDE